MGKRGRGVGPFMASVKFCTGVEVTLMVHVTQDRTGQDPAACEKCRPSPLADPPTGNLLVSSPQ